MQSKESGPIEDPAIRVRTSFQAFLDQAPSLTAIIPSDFSHSQLPFLVFHFFGLRRPNTYKAIRQTPTTKSTRD
jgi:hypothetical protein